MITIKELLRQDTKLAQFVRFALVGGIATVLHYGIYWVLKHWIWLNVAYTLGYVLSFCANLYLTSRFTFRTDATVKRSAGFAGAHVVNYCLHIVLLNLFVWLGVNDNLAPVFVLCIAVPTNFVLVRTVFK